MAVSVEWPPEKVLANRFARGEIDGEEYRQRLDTLCGNKSRSTQARQGEV